MSGRARSDMAWRVWLLFEEHWEAGFKKAILKNDLLYLFARSLWPVVEQERKQGAH